MTDCHDAVGQREIKPVSIQRVPDEIEYGVNGFRKLNNNRSFWLESVMCICDLDGTRSRWVSGNDHNSNIQGSSARHGRWKTIIFEKWSCRQRHDVRNEESAEILIHLFKISSDLTWNARWGNRTRWTRCDIAFRPYSCTFLGWRCYITFWILFFGKCSREKWIQRIQYQVSGDAIWHDLELNISRLWYCVVGRCTHQQVPSRAQSLILRSFLKPD